MYSNKENVNILTALLVAHGVREAVVCPGSRNSCITHNLCECEEITCYPVTDERSAGFYALGMAQALQRPVVVCVTSGTALLNLAPAIAEAYYQHIPVVAISADRPAEWIDQLDGQTLPQSDALGRFVKKAVSLPEPHNADERWYCNRLVNEALLSSRKHGGGPVHINVPIAEPLFDYSVATLPTERKIDFIPATMSSETLSLITHSFLHANRPMLISGQPMNPLLDEAVMLIEDDESYHPDFVLYTGGSIVSKRLKHFLRNAKETWVVNETGEATDTFMNATKVIEGNEEVVTHLQAMLKKEPHPFVERWKALINSIRTQVDAYNPPYSQMAAVKLFEQQLSVNNSQSSIIHYANSTAIRLANIYAQHPVYCNRGVNGIEGTLSTAAGFSCGTNETVYCVIGDLSFFYDQNALWNQNLKGNLRILLINNGKGGIFNQLSGLEKNPARDAFIAAAHHTSAEGICRQNDIVYLSASDMSQLQAGIDTLFNIYSDRPVLLEVCSDSDTDAQTLKDYYKHLKI